jgi:hypothetical protein
MPHLHAGQLALQEAEVAGTKQGVAAFTSSVLLCC